MKAGVDYFPGKTSINQVSRGLKELIRNSLIEHGMLNLDYGGGKYNTGTRYLLEFGITNVVYDLYCRTEKENKRALEVVDFNEGADSVTLLNVLNTIHSREERIKVITDAYGFGKGGASLVITVYTGDNSGVGSISKTGDLAGKQKARLLRRRS